MNGGMARSGAALPFLPRFFLDECGARAAAGGDRPFGDDTRAAARCDFHSAFAGARDRFFVMNGFGPRPLPAAISSIERLEATDASSSKILFFSPSRANASRCLIRSQLVRFSPSRLRIRVRIQPP